ncbi:uncharacterized protein LOC135958403 [Calliphora vicina]|uniref:uncharacterized protein LOC135958403 n=1 Tax=Calliphora vicina TaxID=7373 RepID=UPI00325C22CA
MEYNSHVWAGALKYFLELLERVQESAKVLNDHSRVSSSIDSLEHRRNVGCVSLFYRYYNDMCSAEIRELVPETPTARADQYVVDWTVDRISHYRENSFFNRNVCMWNKLPPEVFPVTFIIGKFKSNVHKHYSLYPPSHNLFSLYQHTVLQE